MAERAQAFCWLPRPRNGTRPLSQLALAGGALAPCAHTCQVPGWYVIGAFSPSALLFLLLTLSSGGIRPSATTEPTGHGGHGASTGWAGPRSILSPPALCSLQVRQDLSAGHRAQPCPQDNVLPSSGQPRWLPRQPGGSLPRLRTPSQ